MELVNSSPQDDRVRAAAFEWLAAQVQVHGEVLPRAVLQRGFDLDGLRVPLVGPQGIFKPRLMRETPLSITTTLHGPYDDHLPEEGVLLYRYRGDDPQHHENVSLRRAMLGRIPLVYFHAVIPGRYLAVWPVFIVGDNPEDLTFEVAVDDESLLRADARHGLTDAVPEDVGTRARRAYITREVRQRLHQHGFRERVLRAYRSQCALCRLRHEKLLDAAHIVPDSEPGGEPIVTNGLSLCKLHHAAFDRYFLAVRPDYCIEVRQDVLDESDGPMLIHGLQEMHQRQIVVPIRRELRPDPRLLGRRYEQFRQSLG